MRYGKAEGATVDLARRLIYYSKDDKRTYGTYWLEEVCMISPGVYKIVTSAGTQFQAFLLYLETANNSQTRSFTVVICPNRYDTKAQALAVDQKDCNQPDERVLFPGRPKAVLPVNKTTPVEVTVYNNSLLRSGINTESVLADVRKSHVVNRPYVF